MEYGIKDAVYPIVLRYYMMNGELPEVDFEVKIDKILQEENRRLLDKDSFQFSFE
jgi:hypothetical protein